MENKRNYQRELEAYFKKLTDEGKVPRLLLHSCCAPCSSYVLEYLESHFDIVDFYYNPNISPQEEYISRAKELLRLTEEIPHSHELSFVEGRYEPELFYEMAKGMEDLPEGGERCFRCYEMRLREAAEEAKRQNCDLFATTLTISPLKNAEELNRIGFRIAEELGVSYLPSDFKKKNGFKRSVELSELYGLYRQDYCGCIFSKRESMNRAAGN